MSFWNKMGDFSVFSIDLAVQWFNW